MAWALAIDPLGARLTGMRRDRRKSAMDGIFTALPPLTWAFILAIIITTFLFHVRYNSVILNYGPIVLTMMGILGCFIGIALGLFHFDTNHLEQSVPDLLTGIKTSFWASIAGIFGALTIKFHYLLREASKSEPVIADQDATIGDLAGLLRLLQRSLAGEEDSTLLSQVKLLRQESRDGITGLKSSLDNYMEKMAGNNSKALIEALREVIRDFNAKINEQFGENFKELNTAVGRLLAWQEAYRAQMAEMIEQQKATSASMSVATTRYSELVAQAERFSAIAGDLKTLLTGLETQKDQLFKALTQLGALLKSAGDGIPRLEEKMTAIVQQIETVTRNSIGQLVQQTQTSHDAMKTILTQSATQVHNEVNSHIRQLSENTRQQVMDLDRELSKALTDSITTLGKHLTVLSEKFVEDYTPLTSRLREIVQLARRVDA